MSDTDADGLTDGFELHTVNPVTGALVTAWDTDGDGVNDFDEAAISSLVGPNTWAAANDPDFDALTNEQEAMMGTDLDGMKTWQQVTTVFPDVRPPQPVFQGGRSPYGPQRIGLGRLGYVGFVFLIVVSSDTLLHRLQSLLR